MRWIRIGALLATLGCLLGLWVFNACGPQDAAPAHAQVDSEPFAEALDEAPALLPQPIAKAVSSSAAREPVTSRDVRAARQHATLEEASDWSTFPRTTRDFVSWVLGGPTTIQANQLYRHVELNPTDRVLGHTARGRIDRVVREYRPAIARVRKLWLDATAKEMAVLLESGGAHQMPNPRPSAGPPSQLRARLPRRPEQGETKGASPSRAWSFPPESMQPGNVTILGLGESASGSWASMKDMPISREAHNASQIVHEAFGKDLVAAFHAFECLKTEQARVLYTKLHSGQYFVIR